ncbi:hypothetical protein ACFQ34_26645 [Pseudonocardia benzenivorans]|uniref:Uncharacterized protein n=2 Tax=Pseudonocardia TaxID=1847 RepID=F4D0M3_PSEUX|nr:hypothetical protein [Pseudonocardia dioxanivorans]AEA27822.1 hypothetical protein Psed_5695 [Pseudonocardia dioxanivorans CB1190]GJF05366.1 hypothetical protein PSD17_43180 [Pseudonocardia sp. D17]
MSTQTLSRPAGRPEAERATTITALTAVGLAAAGAITGLVIALTHDTSPAEPLPMATVVAAGHQNPGRPAAHPGRAPQSSHRTDQGHDDAVRPMTTLQLPHPAI